MHRKATTKNLPKNCFRKALRQNKRCRNKQTKKISIGINFGQTVSLKKKTKQNFCAKFGSGNTAKNRSEKKPKQTSIKSEGVKTAAKRYQTNKSKTTR